MQFHTFFAVAGCAAIFLNSAPAEIIGIETFDYADGAIDGQSGGTHWDWNNTASSATHTGNSSTWFNQTSAGK